MTGTAVDAFIRQTSYMYFIAHSHVSVHDLQYLIQILMNFVLCSTNYRLYKLHVSARFPH